MAFFCLLFFCFSVKLMISQRYFPQLIDAVIPSNVVIFILCISGIGHFNFNEHRFFELAVIGLNLVWILVSAHYRKSLIRQFYYFSVLNRYALIALWGLALISTIYAPLSHYAWLEICTYVGLFFLSLSIANIAFKQPLIFQKFFVLTLISGSSLYQLIFFSGYLASLLENIPLEWPEPFIGFDNIRFFNQFHLWIYFLISLPLIDNTPLSRMQRFSLYCLACGWAMLLFVSGSRGAIVAVFLSLIFSEVVFKKSALPLLKLQACLLFIGFLASLFLFKFLPPLINEQAQLGWRTVEQITDNSPRLYLWKLALDYIATHPMLGIGAMHYAYYPNTMAMHPHNSFLQWTAEMGLPSALILTALISRALLQWIRYFQQHLQGANAEPKQKQLWLTLFCTMLAGLIYSQVDGVIVMPVSQVIMATLAGAMFGLYFNAINTQAESSNLDTIGLKQHLSMVLLVALTLISLIYLVMPKLEQQLSAITEVQRPIEPSITPPRFWSNGKIS